MAILIEARSTQINGFSLKRLLPYAKKRSIGPFIFLDHAGPITLKTEQAFDVLPHPHIGLATLSYLFSGKVIHRDSLGTYQDIGPGDVNLMTAGKGIVHSERLPPERPLVLHSLQFWLALPQEQQDCEPAFFHCKAEQLSTFQINASKLTLILGQAWQYESPVKYPLPGTLLEVHNENEGNLDLKNQFRGELGILVIRGEVEMHKHSVKPGQILFLPEDEIGAITLRANTHIMLLGGLPLAEERKMFWNFAHTDPAKIEAAKKKWAAQQFAKIPGDSEEFMPLP